VASNRKDPVAGLVNYVLDTKPYHSKILEVLIEYLYTDTANITIVDRIFFDINLLNEGHYVFNPEGWDTYPWGVLSDDSDPFIISGSPLSGYKIYYPFGLDPIIGHWDYTLGSPTVAGPSTVYAIFSESLTFDYGLDQLTLSDTLTVFVDVQESNSIDVDYGSLGFIGSFDAGYFGIGGFGGEFEGYDL